MARLRSDRVGSSWSTLPSLPPAAVDASSTDATTDATAADADAVAPARRADLYLEGSDQHRGWFQSSLLTFVGVHGGAVTPFAHAELRPDCGITAAWMAI